MTHEWSWSASWQGITAFLVFILVFIGFFLLVLLVIGFSCYLLFASRKSVFKLSQRICRHAWEYDTPFKRRCAHCKLRQWVMTNRYPDIGEPASEWVDMVN